MRPMRKKTVWCTTMHARRHSEVGKRLHLITVIVLLLFCTTSLSEIKNQRCSDSPYALGWCTSCRFRYTFKQCTKDVSFGTSGTGIDMCSRTLNECEHQSASLSYPILSIIDMAYVISFKKEPDILIKLGDLLGSDRAMVMPAINGSLIRSTTRTAGESGLMASTVSVMRHALHNNYKTVMVFDDDALLATNFAEKMSALASDSSCFCFLRPNSGCPPGVLMLGGTVIGNADIFGAWDDEKSMKNRACVNFIRGTWGSFANIYNTHIFTPMIRWMSEEQTLPVDAVYTYLAMRGYIVRVAYPFLSMALMNTSSTVQSQRRQARFASPQARAEWYYMVNRWNVHEFY